MSDDLVKRLEILEAWLMENDVDMQMPEGMFVPTEQARLLEAENKRLREAFDAGHRLRQWLSKSVNAGPLTKGPSREAALMREWYKAMDAAAAAMEKK